MKSHLSLKHSCTQSWMSCSLSSMSTSSLCICSSSGTVISLWHHWWHLLCCWVPQSPFTLVTIASLQLPRPVSDLNICVWPSVCVFGSLAFTLMTTAFCSHIVFFAISCPMVIWLLLFRSQFVLKLVLWVGCRLQSMWRMLLCYVMECGWGLILVTLFLEILWKSKVTGCYPVNYSLFKVINVVTPVKELEDFPDMIAAILQWTLIMRRLFDLPNIRFWSRLMYLQWECIDWGGNASTKVHGSRQAWTLWPWRQWGSTHSFFWNHSFASWYPKWMWGACICDSYRFSSAFGVQKQEGVGWQNGEMV